MGETTAMRQSVPITGITQLSHCCMFCISRLSICSVSLVKRLRIRPVGVESKNDVGAPKTASLSSAYSFAHARCPITTIVSTDRRYTATPHPSANPTYTGIQNDNCSGGGQLAVAPIAPQRASALVHSASHESVPI